jgi:hypothetical protein
MQQSLEDELLADTSYLHYDKYKVDTMASDNKALCPWLMQLNIL